MSTTTLGNNGTAEAGDASGATKIWEFFSDGYGSKAHYFGGHRYPADQEGTLDCVHGCGSSCGGSMSHGVFGLDAVSGPCPANQLTKDGKPLGSGARLSLQGAADIIVRRTMEGLKKELAAAKERIEKEIDPEKSALAKELADAQREVARIRSLQSRMRAFLDEEKTTT
jgi:hypothetical protein